MTSEQQRGIEPIETNLGKGSFDVKSKLSFEESPKQLQLIDVTIPENNGYYSQPDKIQRVIDHLHQFDKDSDLIKTNEVGRYQLKVGEESKTFILEGILRQHYGFEI